MKVSARNQIEGTITKITRGAVTSVVYLTVAEGVTLTAVLSNGALRDLDLAEGQSAYALIKASNIMLGVDD